jgi:hypothetical protein
MAQERMGCFRASVRLVLGQSVWINGAGGGLNGVAAVMSPS